MSISGVGSTSSQNQTSVLGANSPTTQQLVTEQSFLQLLITELQNQDPLSPADPTQMVAQLASFSSLEQMTAMNTSMQQVLENSAVSLIGQTVTVANTAVQSGFSTGQVTGIVYYENTPAVQMTVNGTTENFPLSAIQNIGTNVQSNVQAE